MHACAQEGKNPRQPGFQSGGSSAMEPVKCAVSDVSDYPEIGCEVYNQEGNHRKNGDSDFLRLRRSRSCGK
ncbi:hypothetical protein Pyn_02681 [Prunus yedoensis var. nudiflora]|uniref:Uncharacterized protein n=1 Tax=Prunus yedoensis var. nudiflora TaxID=2094558 RepID=A0A314YKQ0_PRUYE|nr:hypothetical protein Pyn_02681 [Prunus yedoensis var. nudiflora]